MTIIQVSKEELTVIVNKAVREAMPLDFRSSGSEPPIKGIHELAVFMKVSPARAQKLKNEGVLPYFQNGRLVLFDPEKVRAVMASYNVTNLSTGQKQLKRQSINKGGVK